MSVLRLPWTKTCFYFHQLASICIRRYGPPLNAAVSKFPCTTLIAHPWSAARKDCFNCSEWPYVKACLVHNHPLFLHSRVIPWQMNTFFSKITPSVLHFNEIWHTCRCHRKIRNAKIFLKNSHYLWSYDPFKNAIFTHHASMNMLKFLLNSSFLCLWSHENEMAENC